MSEIKNEHNTERFFSYVAVKHGGRGLNTWDEEIEVHGFGMTIRQALEEIEKNCLADEEIISIERQD